MPYIKRIIDEDIKNGLAAAGAVAIRGPRACGKTETALQYASSDVNLIYDVAARDLARLAPSSILEGDTPRLIDEWQEAPDVWNAVKTEVDRRKTSGQFILTGSSAVNKDNNLHSGAGRFILHDMSTMTWAELGYSNATVSLGDLLAGSPIKPSQNKTELSDILTRLVVGGWPMLIGKTERQAKDINKAYVDLLLSDDISRVSGIERDRRRATQIFTSLSRNIATTVGIATLSNDSESNEVDGDDVTVSRQATYDYLEDLKKLMIVIDQPAWRPHVRSAVRLRTKPKRHLADPSLAVAALGISSKTLIKDLRYTGFLFESQVFHDLTVYARANDAELSYYRDSSDSEVDIIVEDRAGNWAAFEVKLGDDDLDAAATKLLAFAANIDTNKTKKQGSLNIVTGVGYGYVRPDGVNVLPLSVLGA
ncbi:ATP-binding protein [Candidatus Saccharibacteria bacterium]|nr:ATP-binding protein [Candidatus Saccharibacteria bacterium]